MSLRPDLQFTYDGHGKPVAAKCSLCGLTMPLPPGDLDRPADVIVWLSRRYIEHKAEIHSSIK